MSISTEYTDNENVENENHRIEYVEEIKVVTRGVDFSVRELKMLREEDELIVPEFQRELVWDSKRKSRFIESILLGYPIPGMFFTDLDEGQMMIIDGQQRINTLIEFLNSEFKILNRDDINPKWAGRYFEDLEVDYKKRLRSTNIRASVFQILSEDVDKNIALYSLFERINTGSIQLNSQEIRRAIYFGEFVKALNTFAENNLWIAAYKAVKLEDASEYKRDARLKDQEIIARYFTLQNLINNEKLSSDISYKKEINKHMSEIQKIDESKANELMMNLEEKLNWLQEQLTFSVGYLFRRPLDEVTDLGKIPELLKGKKFNIPLFESLMVCLNNKNLDTMKFNIEAYYANFEDNSFIDAISVQTNRYEKIKYRLNAIEKVFSYV